MHDVRNISKSLTVVALGMGLYTALNWVPLLGPIAVGFLVGYFSAGSFRNGFKHAAASSILGSFLLAYLIYSYVVVEDTTASTTLILTWLLIVWNAAGILLASCAGGFGALAKEIQSLFPPELSKILSGYWEPPGTDYLICPSCGQGNIARADTCVNCGHLL